MLYKNQNRWQIDKGNFRAVDILTYKMSNHCFRGPRANLIGGKDFKMHRGSAEMAEKSLKPHQDPINKVYLKI